MREADYIKQIESCLRRMAEINERYDREKAAEEGGQEKTKARQRREAI